MGGNGKEFVNITQDWEKAIDGPCCPKTAADVVRVHLYKSESRYSLLYKKNTWYQCMALYCFSTRSMCNLVYTYFFLISQC